MPLDHARDTVASPAAVDVLIPAYNAAATVEGAVRSILGQTRRDIRVIVIDDGSTDSTPVILDRLAAEDPRLEVIRRPNGGIVDALNAGLALCTAPLVARHDADDLAFADRLAAQIEYLDRHPDCVAVGANARHIDGDGRPTGVVTTFGAVDADPAALPSREPYIIHPFLTARLAPIRAVGGYRHAFHAEDTDLYWRLLAQGRLHNLPEVLGLYRLHAASVTNRSLRKARISALNAQLAAVSHRRRLAGQPDLAFPRERLAPFEAAGDLAGMLDLVQDLTATERRYVAAATAVKLMSATLFRPFELDLSDCRFIRAALENAPPVPEANRREVRWFVASTGRRLLARGRVQAFLALVPATLFHRVGLQAARGLARRLRQRVAAVRRPSNSPATAHS